MVRLLPADTNLTEDLTGQALERVVPPAAIQAVATAYGRPGRRRRKLPLEVLLVLSILMSLYSEVAPARVLGKLYRGSRLLGPAPVARLAGRGALCQGQVRLGVRPVVALFHQVCRPPATCLPLCGANHCSLAARAATLSARYFAGKLRPSSIRWVTTRVNGGGAVRRSRERSASRTRCAASQPVWSIQ